MSALTRREIKGYGYIPDLPDTRDLLMTKRLLVGPKRVSLRDGTTLGVPFDQGDLGSCTANAIGKAYRHALAVQGKLPFDPSRLFVYYGEREIEGTIASDSGAMIRDGMKVISKLGVPPEPEWQYDIRRFDTKPSQTAYDEAAKHQCIRYRRVAPTLKGIVDALARGFPVVAGFTVYESFDADAAGTVPTPRPDEAVYGGHAQLITGYDKTTPTSARLEWLGSWGTEWASGGYCYTSSAFLKAAHVSDCWTIEVTE